MSMACFLQLPTEAIRLNNAGLCDGLIESFKYAQEGRIGWNLEGDLFKLLRLDIEIGISKFLGG